MSRVEFPDLEDVLTGYLPELLDGVTCTTRVPSERPGRFLKLNRTGGGRRGRTVETAWVDFEAWGETETEAYELAAAAVSHLEAAPGDPRFPVNLYRVAVAGAPGVLPDPVSDAFRYVFKLELVVAGLVVS